MRTSKYDILHKKRNAPLNVIFVSLSFYLRAFKNALQFKAAYKNESVERPKVVRV